MSRAKRPALKLEYEVVTVGDDAAYVGAERATYTVVHGKLFVGSNRYLLRGSVVSMFPREARLHLHRGTLVDGIDEKAILAGIRAAQDAADDEARIAAEA